MSDEFRMTTGQAHELAMAFGRNGWTNADVKKMSEGDLLARLLPIIRGQAEVAVSADPIFKVTVDYGQTLAQMIAAGKYDWVNGDITSERFPIQGEGKVEHELVLVHLNKVATTDEVLAELDRRGLKPAKIEELLALGASRPDLQKEFPIVALGSHFVRQHGGRDFAYLDWDDYERELDLYWDDYDWHEIYRFLAVRK